jgi:hypothetical protein
MIDRYAESLIAIATLYRGHGMATVERVITGPTRTDGLHWLVVLYRSSEVSHGEQLVGYGMYISEARYAELDPDQFDYLVADIWSGAIDEPPGTDLPAKCLNPGGIAWWQRVQGWSVETGPPEDGLLETRTYWLDESTAPRPVLPTRRHADSRRAGRRNR